MINYKKKEERHKDASRLLTKSVYDSARISFMGNNFVNLILKTCSTLSKAQFIIVLTCGSKFT